MNVTVFGAPDTVPTVVTFDFATKLSAALERMGLTVTRLFSIMSTNWGYQLNKWFNNAPLICYLGHGDIDKLYGEIPEGLLIPLINTKTTALFQDKVVLTIACLSGNELGPALEGVAKAYSGSIDYMFVGFPDEQHDYGADFMQTWFTLIRAFIAGETLNSAVSLYRQKCSEYIDLYNEMAAKPPEKQWLSAEAYSINMKRNKDGYRIFGNGNITIDDLV